jgi:hypothetical protein
MPEFVYSTQDMEVVLNNVPLRTLGPVGFDLINLYGRKVHQGDPQVNDHPTDSTISQQDHQGGIGTLIYEGDEDRGNSWFSTCWMQTSKTLALPVKTQTYTVEGEEDSFVYVHDVIAGSQVITFGQKVYTWDEGTQNVATVGAGVTLGSTPEGGGVTWGDANTSAKMYIPCGATYVTFDGAAQAAGTVSEGAISFAIWSEKLFKLDSSGKISFTVDGTTWTPKGQLTDGSTPRKLFVFYDKGNNQVLHLSTSKNVHALDFDNGRLVETDLIYPDHPTQGIGVARWRADAYISVGLGIHRQANGLITAVGPDGRDGLPAEYADGWFTDLRGSYNELLGLLAGGEIIEEEIVETADLGVSLPDAMYSQGGGRFAMLLGYNGLGWHPRWLGTRTPTNIAVSSQDGVYRVFWGDQGNLHTQILPLGYYNPAYRQQRVPMERYARHETPYYNWGMINVPKILKYFETHTTGCDENNYIKIWCRFDDDPQWGDGTTSGSPLATITTDGQHRYLTGYETFGDRLLHAGKTHEKVQFAFEFFGDPNDEYATPSMDWYTIVGRKWMRTVRVFTFQVDATAPHKGVDEASISAHLYASARRKGGVPLVIADQTFMVDVTADSGNIEAGMTWKAFHNVSCVEMIEEDNE